MKKIMALLHPFLLLSGIVASQTKPNIVFILADDLGYGDLSCYGQQKFTTPNIDKLAASGMRFTQFYAGTSVCAPSRSSLLSGLHTGHSFIGGNKEIYPEGQEPIADSVYTIAENLKRAGYVTGAFGKWGLGFVGTEGDPVKQGFDFFYGYNCQRQSHRYYPGHLWRNDAKEILKGNDELKHQVTYAPDLIQQEALSFIDAQKDHPFFLFLPYILPHAELVVPRDSIFTRFENKFSETVYKGQDYGDSATAMGYVSQAKPHATFAAMVTRLDLYVGQVMQKLKTLGLDKNTLVIFSSDNGPHNEGGADPAFFNGSGGLRGIKRDLYEGGIRVPFIASFPGKIKAGSSNDHIGAFWDLFPTFSGVAGIKNNIHTDGISFWPALSGQGSQPGHAYLYWEFHEMGGRQAVRQGKWKGIKLKVKTTSPVFELYDLEQDKAETTNLAARYPEVVKKLSKLIETAHQENSTFPLLSHNSN